MIYTRICDLLRIEHPILLDGMGTATFPALVAAVSDAGGFGTQTRAATFKLDTGSQVRCSTWPAIAMRTVEFFSDGLAVRFSNL